MKQQAGFSLVELMVVLVITVVLVGIAVPSFSWLIRSTNMSGAVNTFLADIRFARSEAVRLGGAVVMCPSSNGTSCKTTGTDIWLDGWIIFQDLDNSLTVSTGEPLLRVQSTVTSVNSLSEGSPGKLVFTATGRLRSLGSGPGTFQFGSTPNFSSTDQRVVCVSVGGRARVVGDGNSSCS